VLTASADGTSRVWSAADGTVAGILRGHAGEVLSAAFAPDGARVATGGTDGTVRIWEPVIGQVLTRADVSNYREETGGDRIAVSTWTAPCTSSMRSVVESSRRWKPTHRSRRPPSVVTVPSWRPAASTGWVASGTRTQANSWQSSAGTILFGWPQTSSVRPIAF